MANLNKVYLIGNLTRDPEIRYTPKGAAVAEFAIAINRTYSGEDGQKKEEVTFVDITLWSRLAEIAGQYLRKGSSAMIEGRLQLDSWEDKNSGQRRSKLRVVGENLQMLGSRSDRPREGSDAPGGRRERTQTGSEFPARAPAQKQPAGLSFEDNEPDDIPF